MTDRTEGAPDAFAAALASGEVRAVDLTQPLSEHTPVHRLPSPYVSVVPWRLRELSRYDERGPDWYRNDFEGSEHTDTHFDAPIHWVVGRPLDDVAQSRRRIGPAVGIDGREEATRDPDHLQSVEEVDAFVAEHGPLPRDGWLLQATGWAAWHADREAFLNRDEHGGHTPGFSVECARWFVEETPLVGVWVETLGIDAGQAINFDPAFPCRRFMLAANKYGLNQLCNLELLPATGAVLVAAPLKIAGGSGSPMRVLAFVAA